MARRKYSSPIFQPAVVRLYQLYRPNKYASCASGSGIWGCKGFVAGRLSAICGSAVRRTEQSHSTQHGGRVPVQHVPTELPLPVENVLGAPIFGRLCEIALRLF